jgi:hypothetical protein
MKVMKLAVLLPLFFWYVAFDSHSTNGQWIDTGYHWSGEGAFIHCADQVKSMEKEFQWLIGRLTCLEARP